MIDYDYLYNETEKAVKSFVNGAFKEFFTREDIEDMVIEVSTKVWENLDKYDQTLSSFSTWVKTISKNHVLTVAKREGNRRGLFSSKPLEEKVDEDDNFIGIVPVANDETDAEIIAADTERIIRESVISDKDKRLLENLLAGLKPKELAEIEGVETSQIYTPLFRLRGRIRDHVDSAA